MERDTPKVDDYTFSQGVCSIWPHFGKFFFAFDFAKGRSVEATLYVDEENDNVNFTVLSKGETFLQSRLPKDEFFARTVSIWKILIDNR